MTVEPFLPPAIPGSWHWSGNWLVLDRLVDDLPISYPARCPLCKGGWRLAGFMARRQTGAIDIGQAESVIGQQESSTNLNSTDSTDGSGTVGQRLVHDSTMLQCEKCKVVLLASMVMKCNEEEDFDLGGEL